MKLKLKHFFVRSEFLINAELRKRKNEVDEARQLHINLYSCIRVLLSIVILCKISKNRDKP